MTAPTATDVTATYYTAQTATAAQVALRIAVLWEALDLVTIDRSWLGIRDRVLALIFAGQLRAASIPGFYVAAVLAQAGLSPDPIATVPPSAFVGTTAAGTDMGNAIDSAPIRFKQALLARQTLADAAAAGLQRLTTIAKTEVADAGRGAAEAAIRLEPQIVGYERYVNLPACSRCIVLAGRIYKKSTAFKRHPNCDCAHRPVTRRDARDGTEQDESELFRSLSREEQDRVFTADGARAIRSGADLSQVVNARRGMQAPGDRFTTSGRGRKKHRSRLSPQGAARLAGDDEEFYLQLLRANRYLT